MLCPKCGCRLVPWPWEDGGYKGVQCSACAEHWWSDIFATSAYEAEQKAVSQVLENNTFPADARTNLEIYQEVQNAQAAAGKLLDQAAVPFEDDPD